jgi:tetratricopeptide (TPR) repeat protein
MRHIGSSKEYIAVLSIILILCIAVPGSAQKKSKRKQQDPAGMVAPTRLPEEVSDEDRRKAEMYHIDAEKYFLLEDYTKAFMLYQKSLELDPGNAAAYNRTAQIFLENDETENAILNAQKALEIDPENKFYYLTLAGIYTKQSDFEQAANTYEAMLENCTGTEDYLFELAAIRIYQKQYDKALEAYSRIEEHFGLSEEVVLQKQKLYLQESKLDEAIREGQQLADAFPGEPKYVLMLAEILLSNDRDDEAVGYLESVLQIDPDNPKALLHLSDIYRRRGDTQAADEYLTMAFGDPDLRLQQKLQVMAGFMQKLPDEHAMQTCEALGEQIIRAHPDEADAYAINGDLMMNAGSREKALEYYLKALDLGNSNYNIMQNILQLEISMEQYDEAIAHGEEALVLYPNQSALYWFIGSAHLAKKQHEDAVAMLEQGLKFIGENNEMKGYFHAQLGDAYNNLGQHDKSDASYEAALDIDPDNDHVLNNYSYFLALRKDKLDLAAKMSGRLVADNPDNPTYLDTHAWVLYMRGDYQQALTYIEKAVAGKDPSGTIIEHYGDILFKLGKVDEAIIQWQKAKGLDDTSDLIDKKIADRKLYE